MLLMLWTAVAVGSVKIKSFSQEHFGLVCIPGDVIILDSVAQDVLQAQCSMCTKSLPEAVLPDNDQDVIAPR